METKTATPDPLPSVNVEQGLYVLPCGGGYSCLGFDVAHARAAAVAAWANLPAPDPALKGTLAGLAAYQATMAKGEAHARKTGQRCPADLTPQLVGLEGRRVEVVQHGETRRFNVGKSTGWFPCHLEVHNRRARGGPAAFGPYDSVRVVA